MKRQVEQISPYGDRRGKAEQVREMFDNIAPAYDFMNAAMTLGIDRRWRRMAVKTLPKGEDVATLDIATGTGDMAMLTRRITGSRHITGIDLSEGMLRVGREKMARAGISEDEVTLLQADSLAMPFADNSFDAVTVAYGVRNFADLEAGYREMARVMRPGARLAVLELSTPRGLLTAPLYRLYTRYLIPLAGRIVSRDVRAYSYLPESIAAAPQGEDMLALMRGAGLIDTRARRLTFGACTLYTASKPIEIQS